jgi:membrane protease YdiL (CAAX protease family)
MEQKAKMQMNDNLMAGMYEQEVQAAENVITKKKPWKGIVFSILILVAFLIIQTIVQLIPYTVYMLGCIQKMGGDQAAAQEYYLNTLVSSGIPTIALALSTLVYGFVAALWYKFGFAKRYRKGTLHGKTLGILTIATIGCYGIALLLSGIITVLMPSARETFDNTMNTALGGNVIVACLVLVIFAPIAEELVFRGIVQQTLTKYGLSAKAVIIIQALLFAAYHLNLMQAIYVLPLALLLGYVSYKCKSVVPCIFVHMLNNGLAVVLGAVTQKVSLFVIAPILIVVSLVVLFFFRGKSEEKYNEITV